MRLRRERMAFCMLVGTLVPREDDLEFGNEISLEFGNEISHGLIMPS